MENNGECKSDCTQPAPPLFRHVSNPWDLYQAIRRAKVLTVEPVIFLYMFATYLTAPLFQQYYLDRYSLRALENTSYPYSNESRCISKDNVTHYVNISGRENSSESVYADVVSDSTLLYVCRSLVGQAIAIVVTLAMGPLSDHYGRRVIMILVSFGAVLQGVLSITIVYCDLDLHLFILGGAIEGMFGGFSAILMASFSYVSDISSGKWRTMRIGAVESMLFLGGIVSQELGEFWFQKLNCDILSPLCLFVASNIASILYILLFLPESLTSIERRRKISDKPTGFRALVRGASIFLCQVKEYPVFRLWLVLIPLGFIMVISTASMSVGVFFFMDLNWSSQKLGHYQATAMGTHMVALLVVLPVLVALKLPDALISLIAVVANIAMNLMIGFSTATYQMFIAAVVQGLDAFMVTPLRGYMSKMINVEDQGALFSVVGSVEVLFTMVSVAYSYILPVLLHHHLRPGMVYVFLAGIGLIPVLFLSALLVIWYRDKFSASSSSLTDLHGSVSERTPILANDVEPALTSFPDPPPPYCRGEGTTGVN